MNTKWAKIAVTLTALAIAVVRLWWSDLKLDATTLGLLVVALLPWLQSLIKLVSLFHGSNTVWDDAKNRKEKFRAAASDLCS